MSIKKAKEEEKQLTEAETKVRNLVDAVANICIFKNEIVEEKVSVLSKKAMDDLERALIQFSPKIWDTVEVERAAYLRFLDAQDKAGTGGKFGLFGWFKNKS